MYYKFFFLFLSLSDTDKIPGTVAEFSVVSVGATTVTLKWKVKRLFVRVLYVISMRLACILGAPTD